MEGRMPAPPFVHLNTHSHFSRGWGTAGVKDLCRTACALGMKRLALTDTNCLYGAVFFIEAARDMGIEPVLGSELISGKNRAIALVKTVEGYENLCRIISEMKCGTDFDLVRAIREKRRGLVIFTDDFTLLKALKKDSGRDLFVEISPGYRMAACYAFSRKFKIPPLATNRVYFLKKEDFRLHLILRAVSSNSKISRLTHDDTCRKTCFMKPASAMCDQFPHAPAALENTVKVADACLRTWDFSRLIFPRFKEDTDKKAYERLYRMTLEGCGKRYGEITVPVKERVAREMAIIKEKGFSHYFLVVADITSKAARSCGRGSAAASIVSYALGITHVDPIRHNLFFERFLNRGRKDPPDIDIDFAWDEREKVLDYVFSKYGHRRAAMVANHNRYAARGALREAGKVFGLTEGEIGKVTGRIGFNMRLKEIKDEISRHPRLKGVDLKGPWKEVIEAAALFEGRFNHLSTHCGGFVVVPDEIRRYCPVEISASGVQVLQWEKESVEAAGLVKIDILGNRSLAVIRDALFMVEKNYGKRIEYAELNPVDDPETVRMFYNGDTFGVFYFESPATRQLLCKVGSAFSFGKYLNADHFQMNVVVTSIIRPASSAGIRAWISRLKGEPWDAPHPLLRPVLRETLGVMVFQEQLSLAAIHLAGFDPAEADTLRKVVSKKARGKRLADFYNRFLKGARSKGVADETIEKVWQMMMGFDGYSFCKPHSASYTMVAYKSAFLRAHYPAEFMASVISNGGGYYSTYGYISEARRMGLAVLPPDINRSGIKYKGRGRKIRVGLMQIKDLSVAASEVIIDEREKRGDFLSLGDLVSRTGLRVHLKDIRLLIKAGCLDAVSGGASRAALLWEAMEFFHSKEPSQTSLFFDTVPVKGRGVSKAKMKRCDPGPYSKKQLLQHEAETLGFILSVHPLDLYRDACRGIRHVRADQLGRFIGKDVTTLGLYIAGKTIHTEGGDLMKFVSFEDQTGLYETLFFPDTYKRFCHMLEPMRSYLIKGRVEEDSGAVTMTVRWIGSLDRIGKQRPFSRAV